MISAYIVSGLLFAIGSWLCRDTLRGILPDGTRARFIATYLVTRIPPLLMLESYYFSVLISMALDLFAAAMLYGLLLRKDDRAGMLRFGIIYLLDPNILLCAVSGTIWQTGIIVSVLCLVIALEPVLCGKRRFLPSLYPAYLGVTFGLFLTRVARDALSQSYAQCLRQTVEAPVLLIAGTACVAASLVWAVLLTRKRADPPNLPDDTPRHICEENAVPDKWEWNGKDLVILFFLFSLSACMLFFRLGSLKTPQSGFEIRASDEENEIILKLDEGDGAQVDCIYLYLGYKGARTFTVTTLENGDWTVFNDAFIADSAFQWNKLDVDRSVAHIGFVCRDDDAVINEIAVVGADGKLILPRNASDYPELFDEQNLYPSHKTYYNGSMFDEVFYARTAYEFLHGLDASESTHPPLGKILIGLGMRVFGATPFGWRFVCALSGALMTPLLYLFMMRIRRRRDLALYASILLMSEFMRFALARIATLDSIIELFVLLMFYFMYCFLDDFKNKRAARGQHKNLLCCGVATACAVATKWTGFFAASGVAVLFFAALIRRGMEEKGNPAFRRSLAPLAAVCAFSFLALPFAVYVLSYIPFVGAYPGKGLLRAAFDNSVHMLTFHSSVSAAHSYSSKWYEWLYNIKPFLDSLVVIGEKSSSIVTFSNPLILLGGQAALLHNLRLWLCRRNQTAKFLCVAFLCMFVPWLFIRRTVFIYQYFPSIVMSVLLIAHSMSFLKKRRRFWLLLTAGASCALFLLYYPVLSGYPISTRFIHQILELVPGWTFA